MLICVNPRLNNTDEMNGKIYSVKLNLFSEKKRLWAEM